MYCIRSIDRICPNKRTPLALISNSEQHAFSTCAFSKHCLEDGVASSGVEQLKSGAIRRETVPSSC